MALSAAATAFSIVWIIVLSLGFRPPSLIGWSVTAPSAWLAGGYCWWVARGAGQEPAARRFWRLAATAITLIGVGATLNLRDDLTHSAAGVTPVASSTVVVYMSGVVVMLWGLLRLPGRSQLSVTERRRFFLDATIVVLTVGMFAWRLSFSQFDEWRDLGGTLSVLSVILLACVAIFTFIKLALVGVSVVNRGALHMLSAATGVGAGLGALAPIMATKAQIEAAAICIPPVALGYVLAARRQARATPAAQPQAKRRRPFSYLPYVAVVGLDGLLLWVARNHPVNDALVAGAAVALTALVVYRQISALKDNGRLLNRVDATVRQLQDAQEQLSHQADHDALTGLANRRLFEHRMRQALDADAQASVVLIDLDDFKTVNDRLGHVIGDELLVAVSERLRGCVRPDDTVARLGGDEFAMLLASLTADAGTSVLDRINIVLSAPIRVAGHDLLVRCSTGIADVESGLDTTEVLRRADLAMYAAKEAGKGQYASYEPELDERANYDAQLGAELRLAMDRGDFRLLFQPVVRLPDGAPVGAEALIRWHHPQRGVIPPDEFIPAAERTGLIVPLGAWVLNEACRTAAGWLNDDHATNPWTVSVNISARQLREAGFSRRVSAALSAAGLPAERLMIEVTETAVFDSHAAANALREISALGVAIALDDFGTGHSSLGLLRKIPVNVLKVDKSFIDNITGSTAEATIATAMVSLANGLDLGVVAEGVESAAQARQLHLIGYRLSQGFHFARPLPAEEVRDLLVAETKRAPLAV
ncbi:bifunctional diguanylate cyclase/phosphodiesterase [Pilimelia columellifera subsp. columellifera]|uniref:Bifunctional diguanylate cyclase/phosphodiesterase n=1 Tax=Pilimelia columellifera subsp. columellifera TaxID=706583 RepID=A0ABN3NPT6_9ACTN